MTSERVEIDAGSAGVADAGKIEDATVDWRLKARTNLAQAIPATSGGAPAHEAGALVVVTTPGRNAKKRLTGFPSPSASALALSLTLKSAKEARELQKQFAFSSVVSPFGSMESITWETVPELYDYLEHCMVVVSFSLQAVEAYSNEVIGRFQTNDVHLMRNKAARAFSPSEQERLASIEEKLDIILPALLHRDSPKGRAVWGEFVKLKQARDATIHIKSADASPRVKKREDLSDPTLFHRFVDAKPNDWIRAAVLMIDHFSKDELVGDWLAHAKDVLRIPPPKPSRTPTKPNQLPRGQRGNPSP
jgi:hypothetical protein